VRALRDVNECEMYPGERKLLKSTGQPYEEVGRIKIVDTPTRAQPSPRLNTHVMA
jgi:hypothetical protein